MRELSLRRGSGGAGAHRGGDGIVREIEALEPMGYTLIAERRGPPAAGGEPAAPPAPRAPTPLNGEPIPAKGSGELTPGDRLRIETPGGGGYGAPKGGRTEPRCGPAVPPPPGVPSFRSQSGAAVTGWSTRPKTAWECHLEALQVRG